MTPGQYSGIYSTDSKKYSQKPEITTSEETLEKLLQIAKNTISSQSEKPSI